MIFMRELEVRIVATSFVKAAIMSVMGLFLYRISLIHTSLPLSVYMKEAYALLHNIISPQMHGNNICGISLQPPIQLVLIRNIDSQEAVMPFIVAIVLCISAVILSLSAADPVHGCSFGGLKLLPELSAPADDLCDAVAEKHEAEGCVGRLS
jgi:hypothetical protein